MKSKSLIIIGSLVVVGLIVAFSIAFFIIQFYGVTMRESVLDLQFKNDIITVFISDQSIYGWSSRELTAIPIHNLVEAHDNLPETSMNDRIIAGTIAAETEKAGTYITQNDDKEFWYTLRGNDDPIITIELQDHEFDRIVFVSENSEKWIEKINEMVDSRK